MCRPRAGSGSWRQVPRPRLSWQMTALRWRPCSSRQRTCQRFSQPYVGRVDALPGTVRLALGLQPRVIDSHASALILTRRVVRQCHGVDEIEEVLDLGEGDAVLARQARRADNCLRYIPMDEHAAEVPVGRGMGRLSRRNALIRAPPVASELLPSSAWRSAAREALAAAPRRWPTATHRATGRSPGAAAPPRPVPLSLATGAG